MSNFALSFVRQRFEIKEKCLKFVEIANLN